MAARVRERTGLKGKALFHPIRVALTGSDGGPELDLAVPAIDRGAALPASAAVARIVSCKERAQRSRRRSADSQTFAARNFRSAMEPFDRPLC